MSITDRTIQRYCHSGKLRALQVDPDTRQPIDRDNYIFLIDPISIPERVAQRREKQEFVSPTVVAASRKERNIVLRGADALSQNGFTQVPNCMLKSNKLSPGAKLTYAMLLSYAWQNEYCFPGQETLAADMGSGLRSVVRYIKELEEAKFLKIKKSWGREE